MFFLTMQVTDNAVFSRDSQDYLWYQPVPSPTMPSYGFVTETVCFENYTYVIVDIQDQSGLLKIDLYNTNNLM